jgi:hypothetical protein
LKNLLFRLLAFCLEWGGVLFCFLWIAGIILLFQIIKVNRGKRTRQNKKHLKKVIDICQKQCYTCKQLMAYAINKNRKAVVVFPDQENGGVFAACPASSASARWIVTQKLLRFLP